jgi:hypothetical protein
MEAGPTLFTIGEWCVQSMVTTTHSSFYGKRVRHKETTSVTYKVVHAPSNTWLMLHIKKQSDAESICKWLHADVPHLSADAGIDAEANAHRAAACAILGHAEDAWQAKVSIRVKWAEVRMWKRLEKEKSMEHTGRGVLRAIAEMLGEDIGNTIEGLCGESATARYEILASQYGRTDVEIEAVEDYLRINFIAPAVRPVTDMARVKKQIAYFDPPPPGGCFSCDGVGTVSAVYGAPLDDHATCPACKGTGLA